MGESPFVGQSISGGRILRAVIQDVKPEVRTLLFLPTSGAARVFKSVQTTDVKRKKSRAGRILHSISRPALVFDLTTLRYATAITAPK
jgi:hypothetical protein